MRTASLLRYLADRSRVHLITFAQPGGVDPAQALPPGACDQLTTIPLPPHRNDRLAKSIRNGSRLLRGRLPLSDRFCRPESLARVEAETRSKQYSLAIVEHFWCADYLPVLRDRAERVVLDLHNIESILHAGCAAAESWPESMAHQLFHRRAAALERRLLPAFDLVLTTSEADAERVREIAPSARAAVYPNSLPLLPLPESTADHGPEVIAFSGNLEYHPNVTAVQFFFTRVWPELKRRRPELVWRLIGKNDHAVRHIVADDSRVELTGAIEDPVAELAKCRLAVVPLLAGSGTRVKIMEAWAAGRAVASSPIGAEGLPIEDGVNIALAEDPEQWVETVVGLLRNNERRAALGSAGRATYERELSWPAAWARLDTCLTSMEDAAEIHRGAPATAE